MLVLIFSENLDPYEQNITCKIRAKSLVPYVHLDIDESDYLSSDRRKVGGVALPENTIVLEFNVLGSGCYKKLVVTSLLFCWVGLRL